MYTILVQNHPALKNLRLRCGNKDIHFLNTFARLADRLGSARSIEWSHNLMVGLNHGYITNTDYLYSMLDYLQDEINDRQT
jgi:hypothetical protein